MVMAVSVVVLLGRRKLRLTTKDRNSTVTAVFGLMLCGRYAAFVHNPFDWVFIIAVGCLMLQHAYNSLGFTDEQRGPAK